MTQAIFLDQYGAADVLTARDFSPAAPGAGEVQIAQEFGGVNYIDIYQRSGLYPLPQLPAVLGMEGAGTVTAVGPRVKDFAVGDRVAYAGLPGAYAAVRNTPAARLIKLPKRVSTETAAASMLQGMTAHYLLYKTFPVEKGDWIVVHAAAGGVGLWLVQWAQALGVRVIGTVGSDDKAAIAKQHGCHKVINYTVEDIATRVREMTEGRGVNVVYDGVGQATFTASLDSLAPRGMLVSFGQASGSISSFDPQELSKRGSLFLTRPTLFDYIKTRDDLDEAAETVFEALAEGIVTPVIANILPLAKASDAHRLLESRQTVGKVLLQMCT